MQLLTKIVGNMHNTNWQRVLRDAHTESILLDQWTAQKSRFIATSDHGREYAVALERYTHISDGDIVYYCPQQNHAVVLRLALNDVLVIDTAKADKNQCFELGHAIGNQHWPAVAKGNKVYVPLSVDRKVMLSVMHTHNFSNITYSFHPGQELIPYFSPHETRRLFGGNTEHTK
jgi:urease accessory protein